MSWENINPREELEHMVREGGGWVNSHAHIDRSYIINRDNWAKTGDSLQEKWNHTDRFKSSATVEVIAGHMSRAIEDQIGQGVQALGSFIDCDSVIRDKSLRAAEIVRQRYGSDIELVFMNQPIKGLVDPTERAWFEEAAHFVDIIGGLPEKDGNPGEVGDRSDEHFDIIFELAKQLGKPLHIHVDQMNDPAQRDTERAIQKTREHSYMGKVSLIHCISLAAQAKEYRERMYRDLAELDIGVISCPTAWIDSRRNETLAPTHNSITPVEELTSAGVRVAIGTDNIADIYKPFSDGDMWTEMKFLLEATHFYDLRQLSRIATTNGLEVLGLDKEKSTSCEETAIAA